MAEPHPDAETRPEGWGVRQRVGYLAAALVPTGLLAIVLAAGWAYATYLEPATHQPPRTFPAPGVETFIHDGTNDPQRVRPHARPDPAIEAAKRALLANGQAGWRE